MRRGKEKLLAGLLTVGMIVSSMFSSLTPVYAAEVPGTTESQVYEETDEAVVQSADETQEAKETETVENTEVSDKESDIESSESINHTPETESTESVESTEGGETQTPAETTAETEAQAETRCVVNVNGQPQNLEADEEFANFIVRVAGGAASVQTLEFVSGTVTATDLRSINKDYAALTSVKVNLDGDLTFTVGDEATTVLPSNMFNAYTNGYNVPKKLATLELKGFTALDNDSVKYLPALSQISMPNVTSIGKNVFYDCTSLTEINLSGVQTIGSNAFNGCKNLTKIHLGNVQSIGSGAFNYGAGVVQVTIDSVTAPNVDGGIFGKASEGSTLTIPAKALPSYLPEVVFGEVYTSTSEFEWNNLTVQAPDYATVTYTSPQDKYYNRAQLLAKGQSIGEKPFAETKNGYKLDGIYSDNSFNTAVDASYVPSGDTALYYKWGTITVSVADKDGNIVNTFELSTKSYNQLKDQYPALPEGALQWNTERDGSGKTILANTKIFEDITLYPIYKDITNVTVKVNDGAALGGANLALAIGKAGADSVTKLEVVSGKMTKADYLWMNKGIMDSIETLIIADGVESENKTVPIGTAQSAPNLHHLEIHGVETMESAAIMARNLHTLILPDVKKTGSNSWGDTTNSTVFIKTVDLSSIEELGEVSFSGQNQLPELNMPNLRSVGEGCFRNAGAVSIITNQVPEIGKSSQLKGNTFEQGSTITVPAQVYDEYMKTHDSEFLDSKKYVKLVRGKALAVVTVKINGTQYDAASVEDAVAQSGVDAGDVESIEFVSGIITAADLTYMKETTNYLTTLKMNLGENLKLTDAEGAESTVLPASAFKGTRLEIVEIGGFTEIKADAFNGCTHLESVAMPDMEIIGDEAFYYTDNYETIVLPASLKKLDNSNFGKARNGYKELDVTMEGATPPEATGRIFIDARDGVIKVPEGALPNYLTNLELDKWFYMSGDVEWEGLPVEDPAYHFIQYKDTASTSKRYAYVKNGEAVTEARIPVFENEGMEFAGWNTAEDGSGKAFDAQTVMSADWETSITVYARWAEPAPDVVIVKINGTEYSAKSVEDAVAKSGVDASDVESIEFVSGIITAADLTYMKETTKYLTELKMNLNENLKLTDAEGKESTVLPVSAFKDSKLEKVEIGGFTEIKADAFKSCTHLESVSMPNMEIIGDEAFYRTDNYETIVLPASIKKLDNPNFGVARNGYKDLDVTMEGATPPEATGRVFVDARSGIIKVPEGALSNYLPNLELDKWFYMSGDVEWEGLPVEDPAYHFIQYKDTASTSKRYAYVKNGEAVTEARIPVFENEGMEFAGWNTAEDGSGKAFDAQTVMSADWETNITVYARWAEPAPDVVIVKINGTEYSAKSVEDAVAKSGVDAGDVESIEFVSGIITAADLTYMKETTNYLTTLKMNLGENLKLTDAEGAESTVLPASAFKSTRLESVEIGGFTEIKADAFNGCTHLESVAMPDMEIIGDEAFYYTDNYETIVLPASIKKLDNPNFGKARNGYKELDVTMEGTTPPEATGRIFIDARSGMIKVPEGALPNYLPNIDLTKWFNDSGDLEWEGLKVVDPAYHFIHYKGANSWDNKYAYVKNDEKVTEARIPEFKNEGMELVGWNTAKDGSGKALDADTVMSKEWDANFTVYAQWAEPAPDVVVVKINGTEYSAKSVEDAVAKSGVDAGDVESIEFVSGIITAADLIYMKETTNYLTTLKMNLGENLKLTDAEGAETTELPAGAFKSTRLESVEIGGFTKVGARAFESCTKLENVAMPNVKEIEKDAFYRTDAYETIILPASLETMTDPGFGGAANGKKTLDVTMEGSVPPTISGRVFGDAKGGTVTVPAGALPNYLTNLDFAKWFNTSGDSEWGGLPVIDPAYHLVHYKGVNSWDNKYAYVKDGETVTEDRIPVFENGDKVLVGWNTEADGTGSALDAETEMNKEWAVSFTVYAQWADQVTVTFDVDGTTTGVKVIKGETLGDKMPSDPSKEGYTFKGWNTKADGTGEAFTAETKAEADMTVYAVFEKIVVPEEKVTVTFDVEGQKTSVEVVKGETLGDKMPSDPSKEDYTFKGWNTKADGTGEAFTAETKAEADMTVYAVFEKIVVPEEKVTVTFDVEGQKTSVEVIKGEAIGINMPKIPEKDGYTFTGWNVKADGTGAFVTAETKIYKDMTVYAIFEKNTVIVVPPIMDSVTAENGKVTIVLKDKPTKAPTLEDMKLQMNLNGTGNKEIKITGFTYDDDKTIVLTFDKVAQTDKTQKFTLTVTLDGKSVTTGEIIVSAKTTGESEKPNPDKDSVKTGDNTPIAVLAMTMVLAAGIVAVTLVYKRKRIK